MQCDCWLYFLITKWEVLRIIKRDKGWRILSTYNPVYHRRQPRRAGWEGLEIMPSCINFHKGGIEGTNWGYSHKPSEPSTTSLHLVRWPCMKKRKKHNKNWCWTLVSVAVAIVVKYVLTVGKDDLFFSCLVFLTGLFLYSRNISNY